MNCPHPPTSADKEECLRQILRARLEVLGPITASTLGEHFGLAVSDIQWGLLALESEGIVMRGRYSRNEDTEEWCERRYHSCLSGQVVWARFTPSLAATAGLRLSGPMRSTPVALAAREDFAALHALSARQKSERFEPGGQAARVESVLSERGASFLSDIRSHTGLLQVEVEGALAELVSLGRVSSDSFAGLPALLSPASKKSRGSRGRRSRGGPSLDAAGRWSLLPVSEAQPEATFSDADPHCVAYAQTLLRRYGVVFRKLLQRENLLIPWRDLHRVYRRLEARGDIRGGRFVEGFSGEQFALPIAIAEIREARRRGDRGEWVVLSGADPLNMSGSAPRGSRCRGDRQSPDVS